MTNHNGNATLFFASLFSFLLPNFKIVNGRSLITTVYFYFLLAGYSIVYFTKLLDLKGNVYTKPSNETHYQAIVLGAFLGIFCRRYLKKAL